MNVLQRDNRFINFLGKLQDGCSPAALARLKADTAKLWQSRPAGLIDINALDPIDPVHAPKRTWLGWVGDIDHEGDGGQEWLDTKQDNASRGTS